MRIIHFVYLNLFENSLNFSNYIYLWRIYLDLRSFSPIVILKQFTRLYKTCYIYIYIYILNCHKRYKYNHKLANPRSVVGCNWEGGFLARLSLVNYEGKVKVYYNSSCQLSAHTLHHKMHLFLARNRSIKITSVHFAAIWWGEVQFN